MEDEDVDYESLPPNFSFNAHMLAGACAGIAEHGIMYPLDSIKTRMQVLSASSSLSLAGVTVGGGAGGSSSFALPTFIRSVVGAEGLGALWRGVGSMVLGAGPAHALYFATYEESKRRLIDSRTIENPLVAAAVAGAAATIVADAFMNPFDVVKQRMQMGYATTETCLTNCSVPSSTSACSPPSSAAVLRYRSIWHCFTHTLSTEGVAAFYVSYPATLAMTIPFVSINFSAYEFMRRELHPVIWRMSSSSSGDASGYDAHAYSPMTHVVAGAVAGAVASFLTTPMDVSKTLLQTRGVSTCPHIRSASTLGDAFGIIWAREGFRGFWRGVGARVISSMPAAGVSWLTYEYFKWILHGRQYFEAKQEYMLLRRSEKDN
eukprot:Partr_v1_DN28189_c0_g1_i1_m55492 putative solute carrier family 25 (mitochondrial iron transporter), member